MSERNLALLERIDPKTCVFWFRRDLRLKDNRGLFHALTERGNVQPIFIFDRNILEKLEDRDDARVSFIHESLEHLQSELKKSGATLLVFYGRPLDIFKKMNTGSVYTNHDYEPYGMERDDAVEKNLEGRSVPFRSFKDLVVLEKSEVTKDDGKPYTVFTPYSRKWLSVLKDADLKECNSEKHLDKLKKSSADAMPALEQIGFAKTNLKLPERIVPASVVRKYDKTRDIPSIRGTSRLGIHLRFGTVSIRSLTLLAKKENKTWLNELIWREFYQMILFHFPHVAGNSFKPAYDRIKWRNNSKEFEAWCAGQTGYPMVDAGMRELNETGFMHNRARMIVASFLAKHLLIDWRWGEAYFAQKLLDFELASNNGGWQWAAGSGCDAAPYFRVFNPTLQMEKFDPNLEYVKRWVPEYGSKAYVKEIVNHQMARERVIKVYKEALTED